MLLRRAEDSAAADAVALQGPWPDAAAAPWSIERQERARLRRRWSSSVLERPFVPWLRAGFDLVALFAVTLAVVAAGGIWADERLLLAYPPVLTAALLIRGVYARRLRAPTLDALGTTLTTSALATTTSVTAATFAGAAVTPTTAMAVAAATAGAACASTGAFHALHRWAQRTGRSSRRAIIIGAGVVGSRIATRLREQPEYGLLPVAMVDTDVDSAPGRLTLPVFEPPEDLVELAALLRADHVILAFSQAPDHDLVDHLRRCEQAGLEVSLVPRLFESVNERFEMRQVGTLPLMVLRRVDPKGWQFAAKYALDRIVAAVLVVLLAPVLLVAALAVKASSPGPVLFRQRRVGLDGQVFDMLKFRSMRMAPERRCFEPASGMAPGGVEGTDRRTAVGKLMRRTFVDELPQLFNVLRGDMSLVGPRPERPEYVDLFAHRVRRYGDRHRTKSGITGWAQVHGLRGQTPIADRAELDNHYIDNWSAALDVKILLRTFGAIFKNGWDA